MDIDRHVDQGGFQVARERVKLCLDQLEGRGFTKGIEAGTRLSDRLTVEEVIGALVAAEQYLDLCAVQVALETGETPATDQSEMMRLHQEGKSVAEIAEAVGKNEREAAEFLARWKQIQDQLRHEAEEEQLEDEIAGNEGEQAGLKGRRGSLCKRGEPAGP